jgi:hypothetical protein
VGFQSSLSFSLQCCDILNGHNIVVDGKPKKVRGLLTWSFYVISVFGTSISSDGAESIDLKCKPTHHVTIQTLRRVPSTSFHRSAYYSKLQDLLFLSVFIEFVFNCFVLYCGEWDCFVDREPGKSKLAAVFCFKELSQYFSQVMDGLWRFLVPKMELPKYQIRIVTTALQRHEEVF